MGCKRGEEEYLFSFTRIDNGASFIFTIDNKYRLVGYNMNEITSELEKLSANPSYVIPKNATAVRLGEMTGSNSILSNTV